MSTTRAVPVFEGTTYHVTRRCANRLLRLLPDKQTTALVRFVLFYTAAKYSIRIHGACFNTNHEHLVLTDTRGNLPDFMQSLNSLIARALNARDGQGEAFWASGSYTRVELAQPEDVIRALAYVTTNPVKDGLVSSPERYPGFVILPSQVGTTLHASRPPGAFFGGNKSSNPSSSLPSRVSMEVALPHTFFDPSELHSYKLRYQAAVDEVLAAEDPTRRYMGRTRLLAQDRFASAGTTRPTFSRPPAVSTDAASRKLKDEERAAWRHAYVLARDSEFERPFPLGSWLLPVRYGAPVEMRTT